MRITKRSLLCALFAAAAGALTVLALLVPLATMRLASSAVSECGFDLFLMKSPHIFAAHWQDSATKTLVYAVAAFSIVQCIIGAAIFLLGICAVFVPSVRRVAFWSMLAAVAVTAAYGVCGFFYSSGGAEVLERDNVWYAGMTEFSSAAFVPAIFAALLFAGACVCARLVPDTPFARVRREKRRATELHEPHEPHEPHPQPLPGETERLELLAKYGALYREGALTAEEFEAIKGRLLPPL